jgi:hypothetical protein
MKKEEDVFNDQLLWHLAKIHQDKLLQEAEQGRLLRWAKDHCTGAGYLRTAGFGNRLVAIGRRWLGQTQPTAYRSARCETYCTQTKQI